MFLFAIHFFFYISSGSGSTAVFIAVDTLLQAIHKGKRDIDVFNTVLQMRKCRRWMVQDEYQYIYIHECLLSEINQIRQTAIAGKAEKRSFLQLA